MYTKFLYGSGSMSQSQQGPEIYGVISPNAILVTGILSYYHVNCMQNTSVGAT